MQQRERRQIALVNSFGELNNQIKQTKICTMAKQLNLLFSSPIIIILFIFCKQKLEFRFEKEIFSGRVGASEFFLCIGIYIVHIESIQCCLLRQTFYAEMQKNAEISNRYFLHVHTVQGQNTRSNDLPYDDMGPFVYLILLLSFIAY